MSIASKQSFLFDVEKGIEPFLTAQLVNDVMRIVSERISIYEIDQMMQVGADIESEELLKAFLDAKRVEGRSEKTIERYEYIIKRVFNKIDMPIRKISVFHLRKYLADEKERGICDNTLDGIRQVLSAYFSWLQKEGLLRENPTLNLGTIKSIKKIRKPYTTVEIEKLKECCKCERDKAIIAILLSTGCRISEICALNRDDIDFESAEILVLGKGNKERTVFLDDVAIMLLKRYLNTRADAYPALFIGKGSERLNPGGIRLLLNKIAKEAGVEGVHPHRFRRTLATQLIDHGMAIQEVAAILGHEKLDTTLRYVYINKTNVKNSYRKHTG